MRASRSATAAAVAAAAAAVALAVGVPTLLSDRTAARPDAAGPSPTAAASTTTPASPGPPDCPTTPPATEGDDRPGPLVREGAVQVALCEVSLGLPGAKAAPPRVLTTGVDRIVRRLNALETEEQLLDRLRQREKAAGRDPDAVQLGCTNVAFATAQSLVLRYADGVTVVGIDRNCGTVAADGRKRHGDVLGEFVVAYRDQQAATVGAAARRPPACPARLDRKALDPATARLRDDVFRAGADREPVLPSPLAALAACRYNNGADGATRTARAEVDADLAAVRTLLNDATTLEPSGSDMTSCGTPGTPPPDLVDVLLVADLTGAVTELRVWRSPCRAIVAPGKGGVVPTDALIARLDGWLGKPR